MEEPENLMSWEGFFDGPEEYPMKKNEDLWCRVFNKKLEEFEKVYRNKKMIESGGSSEENGSDFSVQMAIKFREYWNSKWHGLYGSFEDVTLPNAMPYTTYFSTLPLAWPCDALQIFSARVITGLRWPLHAFGMVALRDAVDRNRNLLFYRTGDNCQILSETDPYLVLTGPTRSVVLTKDDTMMIEVYLKVKGDTESEDNYLIYYADCVPIFSSDSFILCYNKHAMLEVRLGEVRSSVEATIFVRVVKGKWPDGFHGHFAARTSSERQNVVLFDFGADIVPVDGKGYMKLSRHVVSVEHEGSLAVYFMAWRDVKSFKAYQDDNEVVNGEVRVKPEKAGGSCARFSLGSCVMKVIVGWSLVLSEPHPWRSKDPSATSTYI